MQKKIRWNIFSMILLFILLFNNFHVTSQENLSIRNEYLYKPGLSVLVFSDPYAEGHQGGIQIIQHENRVAANGDLRLEAAPGQWQPFSQTNHISVDSLEPEIVVLLSYPNVRAKSRYFNRIEYPELEFGYKVSVKADTSGNSFRISVDLEKALPKEWVGKVGFNLELFPGNLFGKNYLMDNSTGQFPRQFNGPNLPGISGMPETTPMAEGRRLVIAPESDEFRMTIESRAGDLQLLDGRANHNNGWFIARSPIPEEATENAIEWIVTPNVIPGWKYRQVIHINQVGYHPAGSKKAIIECDLRDTTATRIRVEQILPSGEIKPVQDEIPDEWGVFGRYRYYSCDFSEIRREGIYRLVYQNATSEYFRIAPAIYDDQVWQPTLSYFLPVQMCHMRINDRYKVWHGLCHMDDARMAPLNTLHFDGYYQGNSTLTNYRSGQHVAGLNRGGWHDAGDYDLRVESQAGTMYTLTLIYEAFSPDYDETLIDQLGNLVELHQPDGKPDILQQIEHGAISIVTGYRQLGRIYRGIICPHLRQYVLLGDGSTMTNNIPYDENREKIPDGFENVPDDRWVFTEDHPGRELLVASQLAASARALKDYNDTLSTACLEIARELWLKNRATDEAAHQVNALVELYLSTGETPFLDEIVRLREEAWNHMSETAWSVSRIINRIDNPEFVRGYYIALQKYLYDTEKEASMNPFGLPYTPRTWGSGWGIQYFAVGQYYLYKNLKSKESKEYVIRAFDFISGTHPGSNTASFVSGVGTNSAVVAYGLNRDDWSYIPGGVISGTAVIHPDFPELKEWPYLWQQTEYMVSGAASGYIFLTLAVKEFLEE